MSSSPTITSQVERLTKAETQRTSITSNRLCRWSPQWSKDFALQSRKYLSRMLQMTLTCLSHRLNPPSFSAHSQQKRRRVRMLTSRRCSKHLEARWTFISIRWRQEMKTSDSFPHLLWQCMKKMSLIAEQQHWISLISTWSRRRALQRTINHRSLQTSLAHQGTLAT